MLKHPQLKKETHENHDFPFSIYPCHLSHSFGIGAHFHDHFEILYVTKGKAIVQIGEVSYHVKQDDILFANMYQIHSAITQDDQPAIIHAIVFHKDMLDILNIHDYFMKYLEPFLSGEERFPAKLESNSELRQATQTSLDMIISEATLKPIAYEVFIKTEIERMFANFYRYKSTLGGSSYHPISKNHQELLNQFVSYIASNYHSLITLDDISSALGLDKSYFCRLIKKLTGRSFTQFLSIYRIKQAEILLKKTSFSISLISEKVGFTCYSYFNRVFKEYIGTTPSSYRKAESNYSTIQQSLTFQPF